MREPLHPSSSTLLPIRYAHVQTSWLQLASTLPHCKGCDVHRRGDRRGSVERHVMLNATPGVVTIVRSSRRLGS